MAVSKRDLEELKPWVEETVKRRLGFNEKSVVNAALYCVTNNLDRKSSREKLSSLLDDLAPQFVSDLFDKVSQLKTSKSSSSGKSSQSKKRTLEDVFGEDEDDRGDSSYLRSKRKQSRFDALKDDNVPLPPAMPESIERATSLNSNQISEMVASMKKQIEERRKQLTGIRQAHEPTAVPVAPSVPKVSPQVNICNNRPFPHSALKVNKHKLKKWCRWTVSWSYKSMYFHLSLELVPCL